MATSWVVADAVAVVDGIVAVLLAFDDVVVTLFTVVVVDNVVVVDIVSDTVSDDTVGESADVVGKVTDVVDKVGDVVGEVAVIFSEAVDVVAAIGDVVSEVEVNGSSSSLNSISNQPVGIFFAIKDIKYSTFISTPTYPA